MNKQISIKQELINFFKDWSIIGGSFILVLYVLVSIFEHTGTFASIFLSVPIMVSYWLGLKAVMKYVQEGRE